MFIAAVTVDSVQYIHPHPKLPSPGPLLEQEPRLTTGRLSAIFDKQDANGNSISHPGNLVGNIGLRIEAEPELPPFPPPNATTGPAKRLNMRQLGYAFFEAAWGKGYATEAGRAIVGAYEASVAEEKAKGEQEFYIEATWDKDNPASQKVLQKLGFSVVGWKEETERVFLAGAWRDPGIWVYGKYVE